MQVGPEEGTEKKDLRSKKEKKTNTKTTGNNASVETKVSTLNNDILAPRKATE